MQGTKSEGTEGKSLCQCRFYSRPLSAQHANLINSSLRNKTPNCKFGTSGEFVVRAFREPCLDYFGFVLNYLDLDLLEGWGLCYWIKRLAHHLHGLPSGMAGAGPTGPTPSSPSRPGLSAPGPAIVTPSCCASSSWSAWTSGWSELKKLVEI